jgi:hypothetical protein
MGIFFNMPYFTFELIIKSYGFIKPITGAVFTLHTNSEKPIFAQLGMKLTVFHVPENS